MSDREQIYMRDIQSKLPAGKTIWAWLDAPFQLDFGRNPVWHFNHDWFFAPWALHVINAEQLRQELVARNVDYIVWHSLQLCQSCGVNYNVPSTLTTGSFARIRLIFC